MKGNSRAWTVLLTAAAVAVLAGAAAASTGGAQTALIVGPAAGLVVLLAFSGLSTVRDLTGSSLLLVGGLVALFLGERMFAEGLGRAVASGVGALLALAAFGLRAWAMSRATGRLQQAHRVGLGLNALALGGLLVYALSLDAFVGSALTERSAIERTQGVLSALWPILVLCGVLPLAALDRLIALHPRQVPPRAVGQTATQWLSAALAIALVFPVNHLAARHAPEWDVAYFRTTAVGESTLALVQSLAQPVQITLFYPTGSDVGRELRPYFDTLAAGSAGQIQVTVRDQALSPALAEELKIRDNGYVVFQQGDAIEKLKLADDLSKAKRELKKLDQTVQTHLLKVARGQRTAYFVVGHGEANFRERDDQLRKLALLKTGLESLNFKVSNLGVAEGLANAVPDDADLLVIAGPEKPFLPEEISTITAWLDQGGAALVMAEPGADPMPELLAHLGVVAGGAPLAHTQAHLRQSGGLGDRILLATNRFGSHSSVRTLARNGTTLSMLLPTVQSLEKAPDAEAKISALVRTFPDTWPDITPDRQKGPDEMGKVWDVAVASTGPQATPESPTWRAIVVGDVNWASDVALMSSQGNQVFILDGVRWLIGDDELAGTTNNEEDVKIQHTREDDWAWFYLTVIAVPLLVLGVGGVFVRMRGRQQ